MFHSNTELLIDYWRSRQRGDASPARADIDPAHFAPLLSQVFIAGRRGSGVYPLRLVGEFIVDLHRRVSRGDDHALFWAPGHRLELHLSLERALRHPQPVVISAEGRTDEDVDLRLEVLYAPLAGPDGVADRFLGLYQPTSEVALLRGRPVRELMIRAVGGLDRSLVTPRLRLAALDGRRIA
jgi:hypothetical protein